MCKSIALALTLCSVLVRTTDCTSSFDQRQTGDLNVQIGLKNINIIALLKGGKEEYVVCTYLFNCLTGKKLVVLVPFSVVLTSQLFISPILNLYLYTCK